jgi:hypothetical protein
VGITVPSIVRHRRTNGGEPAMKQTKLPGKRLVKESDISAASEERAFAEVVKMIQAARGRAFSAVNTALVELYWQLGEFEFLDLPPQHSESDLQRALVEHLKQFLIELGRDFCFVGSQYSIQVGGRDFSLDLLFFNRALNCLVAFELKVVEFEPEHLGKLQFYLEALDRDVKKPHEQPSIGVLLCATKNNEVVEYTLSRSMSPALVAEYQTRLPDRKMLQAKLHEFYALAESERESDADAGIVPQPVVKSLPDTNPRKVREKSLPHPTPRSLSKNKGRKR